MTARVTFFNTQVTSAELPILVPFANGDKVYYMPKINDIVICIFINKSQGFILGSFYAENRLPSEFGNMSYVEFEDGTKINYDKDRKKLSIDCVGDVSINSAKDISIMSSQSINIRSSEDINIQSDKNVNVKGKVVSVKEG